MGTIASICQNFGPPFFYLEFVIKDRQVRWWDFGKIYTISFDLFGESVFSWAIIPQWKVFYTVSLTLSSSSRRLVVSTRTSNHVCLWITPNKTIFFRRFWFYLLNSCCVSFPTAAKSAGKLTPELVNFLHYFISLNIKK